MGRRSLENPSFFYFQKGRIPFGIFVVMKTGTHLIPYIVINEGISGTILYKIDAAIALLFRLARLFIPHCEKRDACCFHSQCISPHNE